MAVCESCLQKCCLPREEKPELVIGKQCVVPPGVYENVTVEINERCEIVRLEPSRRFIVKGCDKCS